MSSDPFKPVVLSFPDQLTPTLAVEILPQGITVHRVYVQADGKTHDIITGPEDPKDYDRPYHKYKHTIIGRYTNRIPVGTYELKHSSDSSTTSKLTTLANESPTVSLHGGPKGLDAYAFQQLGNPDELELFSSAEKDTLKNGAVLSFVLFRHVSPDGDQGYPGELTVEVLAGLILPSSAQMSGPHEEYDIGSLFFVYRAIVKGRDGAKVVTPVNLTQHWGFNLDASLRQGGSPTIHNHQLHVAADNILELGPGYIATGKLTPVKGTPHDHQTTGETLGSKYPKSGFDDYYLFSEPPSPRNVAPCKFSLASLSDATFDYVTPVASNVGSNPPYAILESSASGLKASFDTNQSGVQFWSCEPLDGSGSMKRIHGGTGEENGKENGYKGGSAAFLEFHEPHAAFLHPELVEKSTTKYDTLLSNEELYHNFVRMDLRFRTPAVSGA